MIISTEYCRDNRAGGVGLKECRQYTGDREVGGGGIALDQEVTGCRCTTVDGKTAVCSAVTDSGRGKGSKTAVELGQGGGRVTSTSKLVLNVACGVVRTRYCCYYRAACCGLEEVAGRDVGDGEACGSSVGKECIASEGGGGNDCGDTCIKLTTYVEDRADCCRASDSKSCSGGALSKVEAKTSDQASVGDSKESGGGIRGR